MKRGINWVKLELSGSEIAINLQISFLSTIYFQHLSTSRRQQVDVESGGSRLMVTERRLQTAQGGGRE